MLGKQIKKTIIVIIISKEIMVLRFIDFNDRISKEKLKANFTCTSSLSIANVTGSTPAAV